MSTKLIRTQVLLDKDVVEKIKPQLEEKNISLAAYIRQIMFEKINLEEEEKEKRYKKLLSTIGMIKGKGNPDDARNHNDIYKI